MIWSLSYNTYDNITVCSLGSLVICGVAGSAIFLGISQSGGWRYHTQVNILKNKYNFGVLNIIHILFRIRTTLTFLTLRAGAG